MRKTILKFGLFLLAVLMPMGCSSDEEDEIKRVEIESIDIGNDIESFFNSEWFEYNSIETYPETFFNRELTDQENICLINSKEELENIYHGSRVIPEIDFSTYTLVIGKNAKYVEIGKKSPAKLKSIQLFDTKDGYRLDLYCTSYVPEGDLFVKRFLYFWTLYPKLNKKNITTKIIMI